MEAVFFFNLLSKGAKFKYFYEELDKKYKTSILKLDKYSPPILNHLWHSATWNSEAEIFGIKNNIRYKTFLKDKYNFEI